MAASALAAGLFYQVMILEKTLVRIYQLSRQAIVAAS
jgi:hypothetical protein